MSVLPSNEPHSYIGGKISMVSWSLGTLCYRKVTHRLYPIHCQLYQKWPEWTIKESLGKVPKWSGRQPNTEIILKLCDGKVSVMTMHFALPKKSSDPIEIDMRRVWVINSLVP